MPTISSLTVWAVVTGSFLIALCLAGIAFPQAMRNLLVSFPRDVWAGRVTSAIAIALVTYLLLSEGFVWVNEHRFLVLLAAPVAFALVVTLMDELLAVRAFGGLLLLVPFWIIKAAFMHHSPSRLLMTAFAYLLVVIGMVLVWSPYLFRKFVTRVKDNAYVVFSIRLAGFLLGLAMIVLGIVLY